MCANKDRPPSNPHGFYSSMKSEMGRALGRLVVKVTAVSFLAGVLYWGNKRYGVVPFMQEKWKNITKKTAQVTENVSNRAQEVKGKATSTKETVVAKTQKVRELVGGKKTEIKTDEGKVEVEANVDAKHPGATVSYTNSHVPVTTKVSISAEPSKK